MEDSLPNKIKSYSKESMISTLKIVFSCLGPFGTAIDEVLFGIGERIRGKRLENFVAVLSEKVALIEASRLDSPYLESEEFYDLTINILNSSVRTKSDKKLNILSKIFIEGIKSQVDLEVDLTSTLIRFVNELTENHIIIFKHLNDNHFLIKDVNSFEEIYSRFTGLHNNIKFDKYEFRMYLKDLENKTLVIFRQDLKEYGSSGGSLVLGNYVKAPSMVITSIGEQFAFMLQN